MEYALVPPLVALFYPGVSVPNPLPDSESGSKCSIKAKQVKGGEKTVRVGAGSPGIPRRERRFTRRRRSSIVNTQL